MPRWGHSTACDALAFAQKLWRHTRPLHGGEQGCRAVAFVVTHAKFGTVRERIKDAVKTLRWWTSLCGRVDLTDKAKPPSFQVGRNVWDGLA